MKKKSGEGVRQRLTDYDLAIAQMWRNFQKRSRRADQVLLPCPFCGGKPMLILRQRSYEFMAAVQCTGCGANTGPRGWDGDQAVLTWNRRSATSPSHAQQPASVSPPEKDMQLVKSHARNAPVVNTDKLDDTTLAVLYLPLLLKQPDESALVELAVEFDPLTLDRLYRKGWLAEEPNPPLDSIRLSPDGILRARELFLALFCD